MTQFFASVRETLPDSFDGYNSSNSDNKPKEMIQHGRKGGRGRRGHGAMAARRGRGRVFGEKGMSTQRMLKTNTSGGMVGDTIRHLCISRPPPGFCFSILARNGRLHVGLGTRLLKALFPVGLRFMIRPRASCNDSLLFKSTMNN